MAIAPNIWLGVSVETKRYLPRLDHLRRIDSSTRFVSFEPLLEDLGTIDLKGIHWTIVGCESGPKARQCSIDWVRSIRDQANGSALFVKQLVIGKKLRHMPKIDGVVHDSYPK